MLGIGKGLTRGNTLRSIVKKNLQAWYKADKTQAPLGEEEITNGEFSIGPEITTNGDFSTPGNIDNNSHTLGFQNSGGNTGGGTISNGELILVGNTGAEEDYGRAFITNGIDSTSVVTSGETYKLIYTVSSASGAIQFGYHNGGWNEGSLSHAVGTHTYYITQASGTSFIIKNNGDGGTLKLSSISLKQTNPNDSWSTTGGTIIKDGSAVVTNDGLLFQNSLVTQYKKYRLEFDVNSYSVGDGHVRVQDNSGNAIHVISSNGHKVVEFTHAIDHSEIQFSASNHTDSTATVSNITLKEITNSVKDFSLNNNNGVLYSGKALSFDGSGDYVAIADDDSLDVGTGDFTLAAWVYCDTLATGQVILSKLNTTTGYQLKKGTNIAGNYLYLEVDDDGDEGVESYNFGAASALAQDTWYRIVVVADRDVAPYLYINGELISSPTTSSDGNTWSSISSGSLDSTAGLHIGAYAHDQSLPWYGMIADVQLYKKAWTPSDVTYDYNNPDKDVFDDEGRAEVLGEELVDNGDFTNDITGWTAKDSTISYDNGKLKVSGTANASGGAFQNIGLVAGKHYKMTATIQLLTGSSNGSFTLLTSGANGTGQTNVYTGGTLISGGDAVTETFIFTPGPSDVSIQLSSDEPNASYTIDNVSVKEVLTHAGEISPTDCTALYRLNEGTGDRVYNAAPVLGAEMVSNGDFSSIGQELVANGDFTGNPANWSPPSEWSISGGKASANTTGESKALTQTISVVDNKLYNLSFEISDYVKGSFQVEFGGGKLIQSVAANGVYSYTVSSPATNVILYLYAMNESKFSIDNISIKEIEGGWGANEGNAAATGWSKTGWSIANGKASVDYNNTDIGTMALTKSSFGQVAGKLYSVSFEVSDYVSGTLQPQFHTQIIAGVTANGVYNYVVSAVYTGNTFYLYALGSPKFSVDNVSVKEISLSNSYALVGNPAWAPAQPYIPQYAMSSYSKKAVFTGVNEKIDIGAQTIAAEQPFSISFWYIPTSDTGYENYIIGNNSSEDYIRLTNETEELLIRINDNNTTVDIPDLTDYKLVHIVIARQAGEDGDIKTYINGVLVDTHSGDSNTDQEFAYRYLGSYGASTSMKGFLDEVSIFNKELSATEVSEIFNAGIALDCRDHSAYLGGEIVTDGGFDTDVAESTTGTHWVTQAGWTISGGSATYDGGGDSNTKLQTVSNSGFKDSKIHKLVFDLTDTDGGGVYAKICNGTLSDKITGTGTKTVYITAGTGTNRLEFETGHDDKAFTIDNVSVKEVQLNGYWRNNGSDTWTDLSPYGNDGTSNTGVNVQLQEVPFFKRDTFGLPMNKVRERALNLDGDSYVSIADDSSLDFGTGAFSIDGWARFAFENSGSSSGNAIFVSGGNPVGAEEGSFAIFTNIGGSTRSIKFWVNGSAIEENITSKVADGDWFHFAATRDTSGNLELYVDSESVGELSATANTGATVSTTDVRSIGRDKNTTQRNYKNLIDDIRLYNRELLAADVAKNYKAGKSKHKNNIVSNWSDDFSDSFI